MKATRTTTLRSLLFLVAAFMISVNLIGQPWFGRLNHNINGSPFFGNGQRVFSLSLGAGPWGYVRSGYWQNSPGTADPNFEFSYLDAAGVYGPGAFYAEYSILDDATGCGTRFKQNNCNGVMVTNAANTGGAEVFALAGVYDQGVFFSTISVNGFFVSGHRWQWPTPPTKMPRKPYIHTSNAKLGTFYITGDFEDRMYVIKVDATTTPATVKWAHMFNSPGGGDSLTSRAVIQSPFDTSDVIVVGGRYGVLPNGTQGHEAFYLVLDNPTGNATAFNMYGDPEGYDAWFTSIKRANSPFGGSNGFLLGGYCHSMSRQNFNYPQWMTKLSPAGATVWSSLILPIYSTVAGQQTTWEINDVFERAKPSAVYENYGIAGSTMNQATTQQYDYLTVFKLDDNGTPGPLTPTEFRYFNTGGHGRFACCYLDHEQFGGNNDGLQMFSQERFSWDHNFIKAYFNGISGCNDSVSDILTVRPGPEFTRTLSIQSVSLVSQCPQVFSLSVVFPNDNMIPICYALAVPGGNNARAMATGIENTGLFTENGIEVYPNPSNGLLSIRSQSTLQEATIRIQDNLGMLVCEFKPEQLSNDVSFSIDLTKLNLAEGIYFVRITGTQGKTANFKIVYKKT